eukprot:3035037-Amphidinium_carterae.1
MARVRLEAIAFLALLLGTSHGCLLKGVGEEAQMEAQQLGVHVGFAAVSGAVGVITSPLKAEVTSAGLGFAEEILELPDLDEGRFEALEDAFGCMMGLLKQLNNEIIHDDIENINGDLEELRGQIEQIADNSF